ncbi:Chromodomain-helicase-DNA-binding protein 8 [Platysternon megacephalum]|uniref:Chromodomain-helicase-DNA-binding protein 8 n=1 Tax=Platysternon megacephalum TaxID=55544 RepID=A0A4D9DTG7_9SAUR|nr:Chromodomain-helicase-DNA-binding protein 8 [Platysternon megacephalum]
MPLPRLVGLCLWLHAVGLARGHFLPPLSPQPPMLASPGKGLVLTLPLGGGTLLGGFGIPSFPTMEQLRSPHVSVQLRGPGGAGLAVTPSAACSLAPPLPTPGRGLQNQLGKTSLF